MLTTQLVVRLQPVVEQLRTGLHNFQWLQRDAMRTLGFVVAIEFLQAVVEQACKFVKVLRLTSKLDEPLVATVGMLVHEDRCRGVFPHLGSRGLAGDVQSAFRIIDNQFLAECIDKGLRTSRDDEFVGLGAGEAYGITYQVSPQAAAGADEHPG